MSHWALIFLVFASSLAPVIGWIEFSGGMENFNVATALESQRDGHWLMPYLALAPRAAKPPLVHWITALCIELVPGSLAWGSRAPSIFVSCGMLIAVYELGRVLDGWELGLLGAFICGTTILFLKFAWQASYDLHLALWVTVTNWQLARATFQNRRWSGCIWAGVALGLALMSKGPPAFVQTLVPWSAYLAWRRWRWKEPVGNGWSGPLLAGLGLMLAVALPWTLYAMWINRHMLGLIFNEVTLRTEASYETRIRWHAYIVFFPLMLPWVIWLISGFCQVVKDGMASALSPSPGSPGEGRGEGLLSLAAQEMPLTLTLSRITGRGDSGGSGVTGRMWLAIFFLVLPIAIMTFFPERRDRYLLPMAGPAALLAGYGVLRHVPRWGQWTDGQRLLVILHGAAIAVLAVGLPVWGALGGQLSTVDGHPWYTPAFAGCAVAVALAILVSGVFVYRVSRVGLIGGTVGLMLLTQLVFSWGYKDSGSGRSEGKVLASEILASFPNAEVYNAGPSRRAILPLELLIYLNRDVPALSDPAALAPAHQPQVLIYPPSGSGSDSGEETPPVGFHKLVACKINTGVYQVFVREND